MFLIVLKNHSMARANLCSKNERNLGLYFDAAVVEVKKNLLLFRLALAIL